MCRVLLNKRMINKISARTWSGGQLSFFFGSQQRGINTNLMFSLIVSLGGVYNKLCFKKNKNSRATLCNWLLRCCPCKYVLHSRAGLFVYWFFMTNKTLTPVFQVRRQSFTLPFFMFYYYYRMIFCKSKSCCLVALE